MISSADRAITFTKAVTAVAHVVDWIRSETDRPLAWIPLAEVRAGVAVLAARLARLTGTIAVADAETDADLDTIVGAALALDRAPLLAGSAGLAQPLAERLGLHAERALLPGGRWLVVAGSLHPATRRQLTRRRPPFRAGSSTNPAECFPERPSSSWEARAG